MASPAWAVVPPGAHPARKLTTIDLVGGIHCHICKLTFGQKKEFDSHYLTHSTGTEVITYTCVACNISFNNYPSFRGHCYTNHVIKDRFKCKHCDKTFSKESALKEHINAIHNFKCNKPSCDKQFPSKKELHLHQVIHKSDMNLPPYRCHKCNKDIDSISMCEDHIDEHCVFIYNCPICNETITKENAFEHLRRHFTHEVLNENDIPYPDIKETPEDSSINIVGGIVCCYCKILYKNRVEIDLHFSEAHPDKSIVYTCNICDKQYEKYHLFGDHCYYHYSKGKYVCESCDKTFPRLSLLVGHAEFHGGCNKILCMYCERDFPSQRRLREHEKRVHESCALVCNEVGCSRMFDSSKDLIFHRKQHQKDIESWCRQCGLQFTNLASAEKHLDVHKKKLLHCPVCDRQYAEKYLLMKHVPQHFEAVFHMCKVCGKVFNAKNRLIEHVKIHSSVKSLECNFCGKGFHKPYQLSQHLNIHTGARPYKCVACPKTFASQPNLKKHMRRMHNLEHRIRNNNGTENLLELPIINNENKTENSGDDSNSQEIKKSYYFCSDDSTMDSETINSTLVEQEAHNYNIEVKSNQSESNATSSDDLAELIPILPEDTEKIVSELLAEELLSGGDQGAMPLEYGPDFAAAGAGVIDLDDHLLPHINPQLLSKELEQPLHNLNNFQYQPFPQDFVEVIEAPKWEPPIITKVYNSFYGDLDDMSASRLSIINTDIF